MLTKDEKIIKLIDFGSCKDMDGTEFNRQFDENRKKQNSRKPLYKDFVGTPNYMAPECCRNKGSNQKSDMWSLGCVLFQLFTGFPPFLGKSEYLIFLRSIEAKLFFPEDIIDESAIDLIKHLICVDTKTRYSIDDVLNHNFLKNENNKTFKNKYPFLNLEEYAFIKIKNELRTKYFEFRNISFEYKNLKEKERLEEDAKVNEIEQSENQENRYTEKEKQRKLEIEKLILKTKNEIEEKISKCKEKISSCCKEEKSKKILLNKFNFFERQLKHEFLDVDIEDYFNSN